MGPPRHLSLLPDVQAERVEWPVPFADGLPVLDGLRGRRVVVLASGDPFWFGAGSVISRQFEREEWRALPGISAFALAASRLGWPLETTPCLGFHAAPFERLMRHLAPGARLIATLRDGEAVTDLAHWLTARGFGETTVHVLEALGGPRERVRSFRVDDRAPADIAHPVTVALEVAGTGPVLSRAPGLPDDTFESDGQITKRPVRALTLSALAPRPGERLWDIGAGSGSVALEWLLADPSTEAVAIETRPDRARRIRANADRLGLDRLTVVEGAAPDALQELDTPNAVFVGGGLDADLLDWLETHLKGTRLVANAVTLETEALVTSAAARLGGDLLKVELSEARPLGRFRGWKASYPLVQWSVTL